MMSWRKQYEAAIRRKNETEMEKAVQTGNKAHSVPVDPYYVSLGVAALHKDFMSRLAAQQQVSQQTLQSLFNPPSLKGLFDQQRLS